MALLITIWQQCGGAVPQTRDMTDIRAAQYRYQHRAVHDQNSNAALESIKGLVFILATLCRQLIYRFTPRCLVASASSCSCLPLILTKSDKGRNTQFDSKMGSGVLEDRHNLCPTGTVLLSNVTHVHEGRPGSQPDLVLSPCPSTSPRDPLNWSRARRELAFLVIILGACGAGVIGPLLVPGFGIIAVAFEITLTQVTLLNGSLVSLSHRIAAHGKFESDGQIIGDGTWRELVPLFRNRQDGRQAVGVPHRDELLGSCSSRL
jgi:hypothetical protein